MSAPTNITELLRMLQAGKTGLQLQFLSKGINFPELDQTLIKSLQRESEAVYWVVVKRGEDLASPTLVGGWQITHVLERHLFSGADLIGTCVQVSNLSGTADFTGFLCFIDKVRN